MYDLFYSILILSIYSHVSSYMIMSLSGTNRGQESILKYGDNDLKSNKRGIYTGSSLSILDLYACHPDSQGLITSSISNFIQNNKEDLDLVAHHSVVFASVDGARVIHYTGMKEYLPEQDVSLIYQEFTGRTDDSDGTPAALKESTHIYRTEFSSPKNSLIDFSSTSKEKYALYTIDLWTNRMPENRDLVVDSLVAGVEIVRSPELVSSHVLSSTDNLSCCVFSMWTSLDDGYYALESDVAYREAISLAKQKSVQGTWSDIKTKEKEKTKRVYYVYDIQCAQ